MVGIMNLDKQITSFLTVELITDCEIVRISADVLRKLAMENIEIALVCNRMQSVASMREYEYRKMILTCNPVQRYEYFLETYPGLEKYDGAWQSWKVTWAKTKGASGYEVYKLTGKTWKKVSDTRSTSFTDKGLKKNTTYQYKIRAYQTVKGKKVYSAFSSVKKIKR